MTKLEYYQLLENENYKETRNVIKKVLVYKGDTYTKVWMKKVEDDSITPREAYQSLRATSHENFEGRCPDPSDILIIDRGGKTVEAYLHDDDQLVMLEDVFSADAI